MNHRAPIKNRSVLGPILRLMVATIGMFALYVSLLICAAVHPSARWGWRVLAATLSFLLCALTNLFIGFIRLPAMIVSEVRLAGTGSRGLDLIVWLTLPLRLAVLGLVVTIAYPLFSGARAARDILLCRGERTLVAAPLARRWASHPDGFDLIESP